MSDWDALDAELDLWQRAGSVATLWWRDDDAKAASPALSRLLQMSREHRVPLSLAVIPATAESSLLQDVATDVGLTVLQHGFAHVNHAPRDEKSAEYGDHRPADVMGAEILGGATRLRAAFGERFLPLFVPPWNRIAPGLVATLPSLGIVGLSTYGPRPSASPASGLRQVNTHADLIDWRGERGFKSTARVVAEIAAHLRARRGLKVDGNEPSGILSHHRVHDEDCWRFLDQLFSRTSRRENVRWLSALEALGS